MGEVWLLAAILALLLSLGLAEVAAHRRALGRIRVRIHVNGTRGKSSVTRLIAAGLRAGGIRAAAKTTGTLPRMITPEGDEFPVFRPAGANIIEQLRIVRAAAAQGAEALVVECMALQPSLQALSELVMIRSTHGVITNARADHLDVMGPTEAHVARALAGSTPVGGALITAEERHLGVFAAAARDRQSRLRAVSAEEVRAVTREELARFPWIEHAENVALALAVCAELGVDRATALAGMWAARPDPGVLTAHTLDFFGRRLHFLNAFAANDPESTERLWRLGLEAHPEVEKRIALFNCRADRPDRSLQLGESCVAWPPADHYVLIGSGTYLFARAAVRAGLDERRLILGEGLRIEEIFELTVDLAGRSALVMGMANIGGQGLDLVRYFRNRASLEGAR